LKEHDSPQKTVQAGLYHTKHPNGFNTSNNWYPVPKLADRLQDFLARFKLLFKGGHSRPPFDDDTQAIG